MFAPERLVDLLESRLGDGRDVDMPTWWLSGMDNSTVDSHDSGFHTLTSGEHRQRDQQARDDNIDEAVSSTKTPTSALDYHITDDWISRTSPRHSWRDGDGDEDAACGWWLTVPEQVLTELVHLFFDKIQGWLPLLHRPRFFDLYMKNGVFDKRSPPSFSNTESLLFCGMFALAARHSSSLCFHDIPAPDRGQRFANDANKYYEMDRTSEQNPTLGYLQGCILLAVFHYTSGPSHRAWILAGDCVRLAYDLNLCNMDEQQDDCPNPTEWSFLEEQRRAFWLVWEIDSFASITSRRPCSINRSMLAVRLPVSDELWFADNPVQSPIIDPRPSAVWKILRDSPNQSERAWYLVANFLMTIASEFAAGRHTGRRDKDELIDAITCYSLVISHIFSLESLELSGPSDDAAKHNWVIGMHMMIVCSRATIRTSFAPQRPRMLSFSRHLSRIFYHWQPEYIRLSQPFLACCLLSDLAYPSEETVQALDTPFNSGDMVKLVLLHYASVWKLASVLLDLRGTLIHGDHPSTEISFEKRFALYFPAHIHPRSSNNSNVCQSGLILGITDEKMSGDNRGNDDGGTTPSPGLQPLPEIAGELEHIGPAMAEHAGISSGELSNILDFDDRNEWNSRDSLDFFDNEQLNFVQLQGLRGGRPTDELQQT
ncbi:hypothetical protein TCE0_011f00603 [Talaromyces pinophilus]|uniref:Xylanolytic transcriptional activator regulatory domain-containing protein n=1 Tax=Talaromyces pinophilus TaxID=128442 RepID=A0A0B8N0I6_TALPI|nr:hypothetical protein TCE0_011f00603 [Talaromyces pinophilus]